MVQVVVIAHCNVVVMDCFGLLVFSINGSPIFIESSIIVFHIAGCIITILAIVISVNIFAIRLSVM